MKELTGAGRFSVAGKEGGQRVSRRRKVAARRRDGGHGGALGWMLGGDGDARLKTPRPRRGSSSSSLCYDTWQGEFFRGGWNKRVKVWWAGEVRATGREGCLELGKEQDRAPPRPQLSLSPRAGAPLALSLAIAHLSPLPSRPLALCPSFVHFVSFRRTPFSIIALYQRPHRCRNRL